MSHVPDIVLQTLSAHVYGDAQAPALPPTVTALPVPAPYASDSTTGFAGAVYLYTPTVGSPALVVAYRGTEWSDPGDRVADAQIAMGLMPGGQYARAWNLYQYAHEAWAVPLGLPVVLTGHSLGGALDQLVMIRATDLGHQNISAVTFGSPGVKQLRDLPPGDVNAPMDVRNIVEMRDPVGHVGAHVGTREELLGFDPVLQPYARSLSEGVMPFLYHLRRIHSIDEYGRLLLWSMAAPPPCPLALDLDGDGLETSGLDRAVFFDHDGDGFAERTGWVAGDDGLLVWDRDGNGAIDSGRELFGSSTLLPGGATAANGFQALAALDATGDGRVDAADPAFAQLRIWRDADADGVSRPEELATPGAVGVTALRTAYAPSAIVDASGNEHRQRGLFEVAGSGARELTDVWFVADRMDTVALAPVPVPAAIAALPDAMGLGRVHDLRQAMARDASGGLRGLVESFVAAADPAARAALVEPIVLRWTGADAVAPDSRGLYIDARRLVAMERTFGYPFVGLDGSPNPNVNAAGFLMQAYPLLLDLVYAQLVAQTHAADVASLVRFAWSPTGDLTADLSAVRSELERRLAADPVAGRQALGDFARLVRGLGMEAATGWWEVRDALAAGDEERRWVMDSAGRAVLAGSAADDTLTGTTGFDAIRGGDGNDRLTGGGGRDALHGDAGADLLYGDGEPDLLVGGAGDDTLVGGLADDRLEGGPGADRLYGEDDADVLLGGAGDDILLDGGWGDDVLDGGPGADRLNGNFGADTYVFGPGSGQDLIQDNDWQFYEDDRLLITGGVRPEDTIVSRQGDDLVVRIAGTSDEARIGWWFMEGYGSLYEVETIEWAADGTRWSAESIRQRMLQGTPGPDTLIGYSDRQDAIDGLAGDDVIYGRGSGDTLAGGDGADRLYGEGQADTLLGGPGNDMLDGGSESDTLDGGPGDDTLYGGFHDDTYLFGPGAGRDTIVDNDFQIAAIDRILVAASVSPADVAIARTGDHLVLRLLATGDEVTARYWFLYGAAEYHGISRVEFQADGTVWDVTALEQRATAIQGTAGPDTLVGTAASEVLLGLGGDDVLRGGGGDDRLDGGSGADRAEGEAGNDTYVVDDPGDLVIEGAGQGTDTVESAIAYTLPAEVERLTLTGAAPVSGTGNAAANALTGNAAANTLDGGAGADTLTGRGGDDLYLVDSAGDVVVEAPGEGRDTVQASVSYALPAEVEALVLTGSAALAGTGNALDNAITGNAGANVLDGGAGADTLTGGAGSDTYVVDHPGDLVVEASGGGTDTVRSAISYALPAHVERLTLTGSAPIDGTGNSLGNTLTGNGATNVLAGGAGNDTYVIQNTTDVVVEGAGQGTDTIQSAVSYALPVYVERLTLTGSAAIDGTGNALANTLTGNSGANVLDGGAGSDTLLGGRGGDTYRFAAGGGQDRIVENDATVGPVDTALFGPGLDPLDLVLTRVGNDLRVAVHGSSDSLTVQDWYLGTARQVEVLGAGDGRRLLSAQVQQLIQDMASYSASSGLTWDQAIDQRPAEVEVILAAHWQA